MQCAPKPLTPHGLGARLRVRAEEEAAPAEAKVAKVKKLNIQHLDVGTNILHNWDHDEMCDGLGCGAMWLSVTRYRGMR